MGRTILKKSLGEACFYLIDPKGVRFIYFMKARLRYSALLSLLLPLFGVSITNADISEGLTEYWTLDGDYEAGIDTTHLGTLVTTGTGSGTFVTGKFGQAIDLENSAGNQAYVAIGGDENDMDFANSDMSISIWYTTESLYTSWQTLGGKGEGNGWRIARAAGSQTSMTFSGRKPHNFPSALDDRAGWHHFVATVEAGVRTDMYIDGVLIASDTSAYNPQNRGNAMQLGGNPDAAGRGWDGNIDDVAVWNRVLTAEEVAQIWNSGEGASIESLLGGGAGGELTLDIASTGDGSFLLTWPSQPGEAFNIRSTADLTGDSSTWSLVQSNIINDENGNSLTVSPTDSKLFYVVETVAPGP